MIYLKLFVTFIISCILCAVIAIFMMRNYKKTERYKIKNNFQIIALEHDDANINKNPYYDYYIENGYLKTNENNKVILTEKGLQFLTLIYNENNNKLIGILTVTSLIISITAFLISISDLIIKVIYSIK